MPLPPPAPRKKYHGRDILCQGFYREDGLWDIEGHLRDEKPYAFQSEDRGAVKVGDAVHDMFLRLTLTEALEIVAVAVDMNDTPFTICPQAEANYQNLVGLKIGPGLRKNVHQRMKTSESCTHVTELIWVLATVAMQTIFTSKEQVKKDLGEVNFSEDSLKSTPAKPDSCYALSADSPVAKRIWSHLSSDE
ncbi:MAG: DUF2889 domain-containing protein [Alphaproteobacteria bacterium]